MSNPPGLRPDARIATLLSQGRERLSRGDFPGAADIAQALLKADSQLVDAWVLLCAALIRMGSADDDRALADALAAIPVTHPAHAMLAVERTRVLAKRGRFGEAVELADLLVAHVPLNPRQHDVLSSTYTATGVFDRGLHHAKAAVASLPRDPTAAYNHALALRYAGRIDEAVAEFERCIALMPLHAAAYFSLADCRRWTPEFNHLAAIEGALGHPQLPEDDRIRLLYAQYKEAHDTGDHAKAWAALTDASRRVNLHTPYKVAERTAFTEFLIRNYRGNLGAPPASGPEPVPIFIVGLPRSGTTLVERIFSAHPDVTDMGETHGFSLSMRDVAGLSRFGEIDFDTIEKLGAVDWREVGKRYLQTLNYRKPKTRFFTEKLPQNYHLVGPMRLAFPQARFVHLRRAPMDSLFGAYKVLFGEESYLWSYRFEDLASAYGLYRRLTDHWRTELGDGFIDVTLEDLIDAPEPQIRRLLDRAGLAFHPDCLTPHQAKGSVSTASSAQIRQPINRQGVGAWRTYAEGFEPLRRLLEADGFVDANGDPVW